MFHVKDLFFPLRFLFFLGYFAESKTVVLIFGQLYLSRVVVVLRRPVLMLRRHAPIGPMPVGPMPTGPCPLAP